MLTSCLKDKGYDDGTFQSVRPTSDQKYIQMALTTTSTKNFKFYSLGDPVDKDTTLTILPINLASVNLAGEDIHVTVKQDDALVQAYNDSFHTAYEVPAPTMFTVLDNGVVTIPKGSNTGYLRIKLNIKDFSGNFALGYSIDQIDKPGYSVPLNFKSAVVAIGANNIWDGDYEMRGFTLRAGDNAKTGNFGPINMSLKTQGANVVSFRSDDTGDLQVWADLSGVGIGTPYLTIDNSSTPNPVTISSDGGAYNNPAYNSRYDPATKTFYISFTWGAGPGARLATDTLVYVGPRTLQ